MVYDDFLETKAEMRELFLSVGRIEASTISYWDFLTFTEFREINVRSFYAKREKILKIGIVISCQQESPCNATISKTDPLGVARKKFSYEKGETIIGINGVSLIDATYNEIVAAIRTSKDTLEILVQDSKAGRKRFEPTPPKSCCLKLCCL